MKQYFKDQLPTLLVGVLVAVVIMLLLRKKGDSGATAVTEFQMNQLKAEMKDVILHEFDSLKNSVAIPIDTGNTDSLVQAAIEINKRTLYELKKKNAAHIDTAGSDELRRIFAEYR